MSSLVPGLLGAVLAGFVSVAYGNRTDARGVGGFFLFVLMAFLFAVLGVLLAGLGANVLMGVGGRLGDEGYGVFWPLFLFPLNVVLIYRARSFR